MTEAPTDRTAAQLATRKAKMDELFSGKHYEIVREVSLEGDDRFQTPFGNKGRNGYVLREIDNPNNTFTIGQTMLNQVAETYGAVTLPDRPRRRRTKEQKAHDDAVAAQQAAPAEPQREESFV